MAKVAGIDLKTWGLPQGSVVLDLGAASGVIAEELAREGLKVRGLEYDAGLVSKWQNQKHSPDVEIVAGDGRKMPYGKDEFDGALALEVLEHISETDQVLSELARVIKPGGKLVIGVPTASTERVFYRLNPGFAKMATHVHVFTKHELKQKLESAGFKVYATRGENSEYTPLWLGIAAAKIPFDFTGHTLKESIWEKVYWKGFKLLEILRLRGLVESIGNLLWPRSLYFYAVKARSQ